MSELPARRKLKEDNAQQGAELKQENLSTAWKTFGMETQAGRMLRKLYGSREKVQIKYPKIKPKEVEEPRGPWIVGGGKPDVDPREHKLFDVEVKVPKFYPKYEKINPIFFVERKKNIKQIKLELEEMTKYLDNYRPPPTKEVSTLLEKEKLQMQFQFRGGKALPDSISYPVLEGELPLSTKANQYLQKAKLNKLAKIKPEKLNKTEYDELFDKIINEIDERQQYMNEMEKLGRLDKVRMQIKREIDDRLGELLLLEQLMKKNEEDGVSNE